MLMKNVFRVAVLTLLILGCCSAFGCFAATRMDSPAPPSRDKCSTSGDILASTTVSVVTDLARIQALFASKGNSKGYLVVTSARSLSGECVSKLEGYDGGNLAYKGGAVVRALNGGLQDVAQRNQKGIYDRLFQRTHNHPGAPSRWSGGSLTSGVLLGATRCPASTVAHLASWTKDDSTILGVYSRDSQSGKSSEVRKLATIKGGVRSLGFLPSPDTDDGQVFLSIENGEKIDLVTVRLSGTESLAPCP